MYFLQILHSPRATDILIRQYAHCRIKDSLNNYLIYNHIRKNPTIMSRVNTSGWIAIFFK